MLKPAIAIVMQETRLQKLLEKRATRGQAVFSLKMAREHERERRLRSAGTRAPAQAQAMEAAAAVADAEASFAQYESEDAAYQATLERLGWELDFHAPVTFVNREYVPTFDFGRCNVVVVVGQDGLVANVAKYVAGLPIVAVNPDPARIDGILLPFGAHNARAAVQRVLEAKARTRPITLAQVELNDGQRMLAFNDFFVGRATHVSARYTLQVEDRAEPQSSSGVIISTGVGSTGWLSSVCNMAEGFTLFVGADVQGQVRVRLEWEDRRLVWVVREPFRSKHSGADLVAGLLDEGESLTIESLMPSGGVIFSDGIESDYLPFNSGAIARVGVSERHANLVVG
jgi:NAD kinase